MKVSVRFPILTGALVSAVSPLLAASSEPFASGVTVAAKRPLTIPARLVTFRDDSGPDDGTQSRRRFGCNVWAAERVVAGKVVETDAQELALLVMAFMRTIADGSPITAIDQLSGPFEIFDDPVAAVGNKNVNHWYFTGRASLRGSNL